MSGMFGSSKTKTSSKSSAQSDPWDVSIPYIQDFLKQVGPLSGQSGVTPGQQAAFDQMKQNVSQGNPFTGQITDLANDMFGAESQSGTVSQGYADLQRRLNPIADGSNLDIMNNPQLAALLQQVGDDAQNRVQGFWASGGRDFSGGEARAVGRGVTQATAPLLLDQYNRELGRTDAAARDLFQGGTSAASSIQGLDAATADLRAKGIDVGNAALSAQNYGPEAILNLEEQMKNLPADYLAKLAAILYPAGQLGEQTSGKSSGSSKSSGFSLGLKLAGQ